MNFRTFNIFLIITVTEFAIATVLHFCLFTCFLHVFVRVDHIHTVYNQVSSIYTCAWIEETHKTHCMYVMYVHDHMEKTNKYRKNCRTVAISENYIFGL